MAAMLKAANDGACNFWSDVRVYGERARRLKDIFLRNNFFLSYDKDLDETIADGFYFTLSYPGMSGVQLARELLYYGISAIPLDTTGSCQQGLRACTSFIKDHQYGLLEERIQLFAHNHPVN